jgi:hypothetical protein
MMNSRTFGCIKCGYPYNVIPPDDVHTEAHTKIIESNNDYSLMERICVGCITTNKIYWYRPNSK